jgi:hypothetical protein
MYDFDFFGNQVEVVVVVEEEEEEDRHGEVRIGEQHFCKMITNLTYKIDGLCHKDKDDHKT